jgi:hypothetical protein
MLPVILLLAGCAAPYSGGDNAANDPTVPGAAAPQRVDAASDALGARMNSMLSGSGNTVTR